MNKYRIYPTPKAVILWIGLLFISYLSYGQSPGGVSTSLELWLKGDAGVTGSAPITAWADQSGNSVSNTISGDPALTTSSLNYNNVITLDGTGDYFTTGLTLDPNATDISMVAVYKCDGATGTAQHIFAQQDGGGTGRSVFFINIGQNDMDSYWGGSNHYGTNNISYNEWDLYTMTFNSNGATSALKYYEKSNADGSFTLTPESATGAWIIGAHKSVSQDYLDGDLAELIVYSQELGVADQQKIESYLSIKYGITKSGNYMASDGTTTLWDATAYSTYHNDVTGIGRDDNSGLNQTKSINSNSDAMVIMDKAGSFSTDKDHILWGNDNGAVTTTTTGAHPSYARRLTRIWRADVSGTPGTTSVSFILTNAPNFNARNPSLYALITDNSNTDFSAGASTHTTGASFSGDTLTFTGVSFTDGDYFTLAGPAPTGPGNVTSNLHLWLKADAGVTGTSAVTSWLDNGSNSFEATSGTGPEKLDNRINYNPALQFNGTSEFMQVTNGIFGTSTYNDMFVYIVSRTNTVQDHGIVWETLSGGDRFGAHLPWSDNNAYYDLGTCCGSSRINTNWGGSTGNYYMWTLGTSTGTSTPSGTRKALYRDGASLTTNNNNDNGTGINSNFYVASSTGSSNFYAGEISEILIYTGVPSALEMEQIQSYLSIKYGLMKNSADNGGTGGTDERDYFASNGSVIWDYSSHTAYHNDVAGIGRDDASDLNQQRSISSNSDAIVSMNKGGNFSNDRDFVLWGNDNGSTATTTTGAHPSYTRRLTRIWKADLNETPGTVSVSFILTNVSDFNSRNAAQYALITDNSNTDFSSGASDHTTGASFSGDTITFTGVSFTDGDFFTLAGPAPLAPGSVSSNITLWLKADAGVTLTSDKISQWNDQSGNGEHVTQTTAADRPSVDNNSLNFNPTVNFQGATDFLNLPNQTFTYTPNTASTIYYVATPTGYSGSTDGNGYDHAMIYGDAGGWYTSGIGANGFRSGMDGTNSRFLDAIVATDLNQPFLVRQTHATPNVTLTVHGVGNNTNNPGTINGQSAQYIGKGRAVDFDGNLAEIVIYSANPSTTEERQIESYLATKYGITKDGDYLASDGTTTYWNSTTFSTYHNDVAGIGRDDNTALDQQKTVSANSDAIVVMDKGGSFGSDKDFILWGNDNGAVTTTTTGAHPSYTRRLTRIWRTDLTGTPGSTSVSFILTNVPNFNSRNPSLYALITDNTNTDFSSGASDHTTGASFSGDTLTFTGVSFTDGDYFTLAGPAPIAPANISTDLVLWVAGDRGVTGTTAVSAWADQSGTGNSYTQGASAMQPSTTSANLNFNTTVTFDGTDEIETTDNTYNNTITYFVLKATDFTTDAVLLNNASFGMKYEQWSNTNSMGYTRYGVADYNSGSSTPYGDWAIVSYEKSTANTNYTTKKIVGGTTTSVTYSVGAVIAPVAVRDMGQNLAGDMAEVIVYQNTKGSSDEERIESYLGMKYGMTIPTNHIASDGATTVWDATANAAYHNDVAVIGRDDDSGLNQKQSKSIHSDAVMTVALTSVAASNDANTGSFTADKSFLAWGNNNASMEAGGVTDLPATIQRKIGRTWQFVETGTVGSVRIQLDMSNVQGTGGVGNNDLQYVRLLIDDDGNFGSGASVISPTSYNNTTDIIEFDHDFDGVTGFFMGIGSTDGTNAPLPVELLTFNAVPQNDAVHVSWATASETNNAFFNVQRSVSGTDWENIATVQGAGNSSTAIQYNYTDQYPLDGVSYYRLKQTDYDGTSTHSAIVPVEFSSSHKSSILVYPNPTRSMLFIDLQEHSAFVQITVSDVHGKTLLSDTLKQGKNSKIPVDLNRLEKGTYILQVKTETGQLTERIVKI